MRIKLIVFLLCLCAAAGVVSCDDTDNPILPGEGALVVGLKELPATPPDSLTLYFFSADGGMAARKSYAGLRAFQADYTPRLHPVAAGRLHRGAGCRRAPRCKSWPNGLSQPRRPVRAL